MSLKTKTPFKKNSIEVDLKRNKSKEIQNLKNIPKICIICSKMGQNLQNTAWTRPHIPLWASPPLQFGY